MAHGERAARRDVKCREKFAGKAGGHKGYDVVTAYNKTRYARKERREGRRQATEGIEG